MTQLPSVSPVLTCTKQEQEKTMAEIQKLWKTNKPDSNTPQDMLDLLGKLA